MFKFFFKLFKLGISSFKIVIIFKLQWRFSRTLSIASTSVRTTSCRKTRRTTRSKATRCTYKIKKRCNLFSHIIIDKMGVGGRLNQHFTFHLKWSIYNNNLVGMMSKTCTIIFSHDILSAHRTHTPTSITWPTPWAASSTTCHRSSPILSVKTSRLISTLSSVFTSI